MTHSTKLALLEQTLESMLLDDERISARGLARRLKPALNHATDITRQPQRRALLEKYQARQTELRTVMAKADKQSKANLSARIACKDGEIAALTRQRDILIASHKAMILAVGEMGGMNAWRRFFERYQGVVDEMRRLGAMPTENALNLRDGGDSKGGE